MNSKLYIDEKGSPIYSINNLIDMLYNNQLELFDKVVVNDEYETKRFNESADELWLNPLNIYKQSNSSIEEFDIQNQNEWLMPDEYKSFDIESWLYNQVNTNIENTRITDELFLYKKYDLINLLRWMKYFVDTCRTKNVIWGVGRGSSVSSYVLYIIGVHKINSIKYSLDYNEFFKEDQIGEI